MAVSLARDAISFLIDLAEKGEINPWDVKVIDVIDRFLSDLSPFNAVGRDHYEANLSQSGQAFLYASMLLLLKADSLTQTDVPVIDEFSGGEDFFEPLDLGPNVLPMHLDRSLRRRAVAQPPLRRRVTLQELISQLEVIAAALDEDKAASRRTSRPKPQSRAAAVRVIAQLAHQENLTEMAVALEDFFVDYWADLSKGNEWMDFDLVLEFWIQHKAAEFSTDLHGADPFIHERVGVFWALLLLSAQNKVELNQNEFYQDLQVKSLQMNQAQLDSLMALVD
jgi:segregation and condensation protein A